MFENIAALDIGTSSIKVVTAKTGLKDFEVTNFFYEDIDIDSEDHDEAIGDTLSKIIQEHALEGYTVITNLPMERAIIRNITFPFSDTEKIADALPYEAGDDVPFQLEELAMDFQPLKSENPEEGRILLAATQRETVLQLLAVLQRFEIYPAHMGLEANALFECYRYFNRINEETVIQIDIGNNKTILNFIRDNSLLYTRCISVGLNMIYAALSDKLKLSTGEVKDVVEKLNLDLTSFENNLQREYYKTLNLNKARLRKIYDTSIDVVDALIEQLVITVKSFMTEFGAIEFNRVLMSGGGSNITGVGSIVSLELDLPVVAIPFLEDYDDITVQTQFPIAFGTMLRYLNKKSASVNFLKGDFIPDVGRTTKKIYYLSGAFAILSLFVLLVYIISSSILKSNTNEKYNIILGERFKRYFNVQVTSGDPVQQAMKLLTKEKKEYDNLNAVIRSNDLVLDIIKDILAFFPKGVSFELKNMVINERIVRIDGFIDSSQHIDEFKNKLIQSAQFDSVSINTNIAKGNQVRFSMMIKLKLPTGTTDSGKRSP